MAYVTGTANSLSAIVTALRDACTANGWTLAGNVLHKSGCYVEVIAVGTEAQSTDFGLIQIRGGTGIDGSNLLTGEPALYTTNWPAQGVIGPLATSNVTTYADWDWPVTYHIHIHTNPDEVFLMVNYGAGQYWQGLSFGQSPSPGCPGTGNWFHASTPRNKVNGGSSTSYGRLKNLNTIVVNPEGGRLSSYSGGVCPGAIPFWQYTKDESSGVPTPSLFHGVWANDGVTSGWSHPRYNWNGSGNPGSAMNVVSSSRVAQPLPTYSPNAWNSEAHLIRLQILSPRLDWKSSVVGEIRHARFIRNDFLDPGEVITLGTDQWKVYPAYRKNVSARNGVANSGSDHSGTCAIAIRYDGP